MNRQHAFASQTDLFWSDAVFSPQGRLDVRSWRWVPEPVPEDAERVMAIVALKRLSAQTPLHHLPIGVIGPRQATDSQLTTALDVGAAIASLGVPLMCGGKGGVMQAAARGCSEAGGFSIGVLPGHSWREANPYISLPITTGLSEARNMIIAKSCMVLIAVGGSYGTLTEIAYGLHFGKCVIVLDDAPAIEGTVEAQGVDQAIGFTASALFSCVTTDEDQRLNMS